MFVVMQVQSFTMQTSLGVKALLHPDEKMVGYLPVYKTAEDALVDYPDGPVYELVSVENEFSNSPGNT